MVVSLANLMRYNIKNGNEQVTLKTDLEHVKVYLELQKMRYNTRLNYSIRVEKGLMGCKVPKFIFQPIVENSIKHGIDSTKSLSIKVSVNSDGNDIKIIVEDDGQGIKKEEMVNLVNMLTDENPASDCRIGLYNAHRVIRLLYGKNYGLEISSNYGIGTKITLTIPAQEDD
jgi:two-component system sensor histidine kinase YesM